jgi:hypothetical protein
VYPFRTLRQAKIDARTAGRMWIVLRPCFRGFAVVWA